MALRKTPGLISPSLQKWAYNLAGFNKYGLWRDDLLHEYPDVTEALRRLPQDLIDARNFRLIRAVQLDVQRIILPKEQWTQLEEDILYLTPLVEEVKRERLERQRWEAE